MVSNSEAADLLAGELHVRSVVERQALVVPRAASAAPGEHQHRAHGVERLVGPAAFAFVVDDDRLFLAAAALHIGHGDGDGAAEQLFGVELVGLRADGVPQVAHVIRHSYSPFRWRSPSRGAPGVGCSAGSPARCWWKGPRAYFACPRRSAES